MVTVTRLGFLVKMEGMLWFSFLCRKLLDNEVISSITVGLVTGQVAATTLAHHSISPSENFDRNLRSLIRGVMDIFTPMPGYQLSEDGGFSPR